MSKPLKQTNLLNISLLSLLAFLQIVDVAAEEFILESDNDSVIGELRKTKSESKYTLLDIARANGFGYDEIKRVNPDLDTWIPGCLVMVTKLYCHQNMFYRMPPAMA